MAIKYTKVTERGRTYYVADTHLEAFHAAGCDEEMSRVRLCDYVMEGDHFIKNRAVSSEWLLDQFIGEKNITVERRNVCQ